MWGSFLVGMALPICVSYVGLSLFIFKAGIILLRFMRLYAYNLTMEQRLLFHKKISSCGDEKKIVLKVFNLL